MIHIRPVSDPWNKFSEADSVERCLNEADLAAEATAKRYTREEVFTRVKESIHRQQKV